MLTAHTPTPTQNKIPVIEKSFFLYKKKEKEKKKKPKTLSAWEMAKKIKYSQGKAGARQGSLMIPALKRQRYKVLGCLLSFRSARVT